MEYSSAYRNGIVSEKAEWKKRSSIRPMKTTTLLWSLEAAEISERMIDSGSMLLQIFTGDSALFSFDPTPASCELTRT